MGLEIVIAIVGAISGGGLFKIFDVFMNNRKAKFDEGAEFRREYRDKINELEEDVSMLKVELKDSRQRESQWKQHSEKLFFDFRQYQLKVYQLLTHKDIQALNLDTSDFIKEIEYPKVD